MNEGKKKALRKLKIARGQIDGIIKMIEDERYCVDISTQILAIIAQLKKANIDIWNSHLHTCVVNAIRSDDEDEAEEKIQEIVSILDKYIK